MTKEIKTFEELFEEVKKLDENANFKPIIDDVCDEYGNPRHVSDLITCFAGRIEYCGSYRSDIKGIEDEQDPNKILKVIKSIKELEDE